MLHLWNTVSRADLLSRREMLRVGSLSLAGLTLPTLLDRNRAAAASGSSRRASGFGKAKNCIILYLSGAPSQLDTFDPKPDAPDEIRGEFGTIATSVPGVRFSELLPRSATLMKHMALVRTMVHEHNDHGRGSYWMFTGYPYNGSVSDVNSMSRADMPHMGACIARLNPGPGPMLPFALVPHRMDVAGGRRAGQFAGALGARYDPLLTGGNPNDDNFRMEQLPLAASEAPEVVQRRVSLLDQLEKQTHQMDDLAMRQSIRENQAKALEVLKSEAVRKAVDLSGMERKERERYGRNLFGQSVLLGRRLLDAGARLVQCNWQRSQGRNGFAWDTHSNNFSAHKEDLVPPFDQAFHALVTDLEERGQLAETLVVVAAEFGRSPKITRSTSGREHWPDCFTVLFAGAGIRGGQVYGQSDKIAAYPLTTPTNPADFTATIYHCLGIDPHTEMHDYQGRPFALSRGNPIGALLG
jgi:hypothetical protein